MLTIHPLLQAVEDQITASGLAQEYAGFLAFFGVFGALGFRWFVLRRTAARQPDAAIPDSPIAASLASAEVGAASIGIVGALFMLMNLLMAMSARAADKGISFADAAAAGGTKTIISCLFVLLFLASFAAAFKKLRAGWTVAALTGIAYVFQSITTGKWTGLVNPLHEAAASLWLGSLFVLVVVGLPVILRCVISSEQRGALVADMVGDFSNLAIGAALLLVVTGITTAWRHLKYVSALWTTPYGYTFLIKLVFVAIVVALGAWNWRRMRPRLGTEAAAHQIRRSAKFELSFAAMVLLITGVLVSLPAPRLPIP